MSPFMEQTNYFNDDLFDYFASIYLKNKTDIFVGWSGF